MPQEDLRQLRRDIENLEAFRAVLLEIARAADTRIAARAIGTYMRLGQPTDEPNRGSTLRIQSGRLSRAVRGGLDRESTVRVDFDGRQMTYRRLIDVEYAAIHEYGGTIRVRVTARMRRFFWAKFKETGDEKWKAMALSKKRAFTITIPARPYLTPAIDHERPFIEALAEERLHEFTRKTLKA